MVLPNGQELFSKSEELVSVREFLMKTCDLKEVINLPSGIFTHTSIKTCVFYFVKKREGSEVVDVEIKESKKTHKETSRSYSFVKKHQTKKVDFYDYNPYTNVKNLLVSTTIEELIKNKYSLNYAEYLKDEINKEENFNDEVEIKTLGEVCKFKNGHNITKKDLVNGNIPVVGGGQKPLGYHNESNVPENTILISKDGEYAGFVSKYTTKVYVSNHEIYLENFSKCVIKDYVYYYLKLVLQRENV